MRLYIVSKDKKTGLYYIHAQGYAWIPVFDSFTTSKNEALKMAIAYSGCTTRKEYQYMKRRKAVRK